MKPICPQRYSVILSCDWPNSSTICPAPVREPARHWRSLSRKTNASPFRPVSESAARHHPVSLPLCSKRLQLSTQAVNITSFRSHRWHPPISLPHSAILARSLGELLSQRAYRRSPQQISMAMQELPTCKRSQS